MVRANTAVALSESQDPAADGLLRVCVTDHNPQVRSRAAIALAKRGDGRAVADVLKALDDPELVFEALDALGTLDTLGDTSVADAIADKSAGLLQPLSVKAAAGGALVRLGDVRGVELLRRVLTAWRSDGRNFAVELIGTLVVTELAPELTRLTDRARGIDPVTLARSLSALLPRAPQVKRALERLAQKDGEAAEIAQAALKSTNSGQ